MKSKAKYPKHVAILGAAGGLGQAVVRVCITNNINFTAVVRSRPGRIKEVPNGSRIALVKTLADQAALEDALDKADCVISAIGVTTTSQDESALLSKHMPGIEKAMLQQEVKRIVLMNTLLASMPGEKPSFLMRFFSHFPGIIGLGAREMQSVVDCLANSAFANLDWTLVRGAVNRRGKDLAPTASLTWNDGLNTWQPVSYRAMANWLLIEASASVYLEKAPLVSLGR